MAQVDTATKPATAVNANAAPLGLMGFGITTLVLSLGNTTLFGTSISADAALPLAIAFGGFGQLLAGMWAFKAGNTFAATAFTAYGTFWMSFVFLVLGDGRYLGTLATNDVATYLLGWTIFTAIMTLGAIRVNGALGLLFTLLTLTFLALALQDYAILGTTSKTLGQAGGYLGVLTALNAFYIAAADILNELAGRTILPVFAPKK